MEIEVIVDPTSLRMGRMGPSTGGVWLKFGEVAFPGVQWSDFPVVVLADFIEGLLRVLKRRGTTESVSFMDGPYLIEVKLLDDGLLEMSGIRDDVQVVRSSVPSARFIESLLLSSESISSACDRIGDKKSDATRLKRNIIKLRSKVTPAR